MRLELRQIMALECRICRRLLIEDSLSSSQVEMALFGAAEYCICPSCGQETSSLKNNKAFQKRVDKYLSSRTSL